MHDLGMVAISWWLAYLTRYNFVIPQSAWPDFIQTLPVVLVAQGLILWKFGLYRGLWRFASVPDLWNILRASALGVLAITLILFIFNRIEGVPRSVPLFYPIYLVFLLGAPRLIYRMWNEYGIVNLPEGESKRVMILGAGRAGEMLCRDMRRGCEFQPVGFLDDHKRLDGGKLHGIPVLGTIASLPRVVEEYDVDIVIIAIPSASNTQMRRIVDICEQVDIPFRTVPRFQDLVSGRASINDLREVALDDLLSRDPVSLDWKAINEGVAGKSVLVSGGGGSIGSELCRQIARLGPAELIVFENNEYNLYQIERELHHEYPNLKLHAYLGDVRDRASVVKAFDTYRPDMVFHAAAYKHVPMLEQQAREAVRNNVMGTKLIAAMADRFGCDTFVMISTDKAVNPANIMGATKRIAEIYCQALNKRSETRYITTRFGNVLGSAGSVVPLFHKQIKRGGPITVTHPEITRYFMTIPEASQLIMQAAVIGKGGEIFVLDMGEPVKISYLAEQMIRLSGKIPGEDIQIVYTGLRPGEKLYEELFYDQEDHLPTSHDKILLARSFECDWESLNDNIRALEEACEFYDEARLHELLDKLVPQHADQQAISNNIVNLDRIPA
ncbi:MAG TPA: polysaccharide biosynthesis protein [Gammaproteobacteria bacterium]|nr:polysaccharide biosynthesis protein [Gammaproteobacteria bacterium]